MVLLVDGMNVIGSRPDGWWRDRAGTRRALVTAVAAAVAEDEVTVVFDGSAAPGEEEAASAQGVHVEFAPGGPNAADDRIVAVLRAEADTASVTVVTSDAALAERARALGATVRSVGSFRRMLDR
ncbi:MAG: NYN domain-containing protein [Acidobacteriota bacterium]|nr:NYN domain-containing protein [Acidobacteriota bacterium]